MDANSDSLNNGGNKRVYLKKSTDRIRRWTTEECALYENFITMYSDIMRNSSQKRNSRIFLIMSKFIGAFFKQWPRRPASVAAIIKSFTANS